MVLVRMSTPVLFGGLGHHFKGEVVDLDRVLFGDLALPVEALASSGAGGRGGPGYLEDVGHPVDAFGALDGHGVEKLRIDGHLLHVVDVGDDGVGVVGEYRYGPLRLVGKAMAAKVDEHAAIRGGAAGFLVLFEQDDLLARRRPVAPSR